jgi:pilus assembly protein Flp/PilA
MQWDFCGRGDEALTTAIYRKLSAIALTTRQGAQFRREQVRQPGDKNTRPRTRVDRNRQELLMTNLVKRFAGDESGATAIEYGLIAAGISVAIITVVNSLGTQLKSTFTNISSQLATAGK